MVLEELEHAKQRGAIIYAELVGYGATGDAYHITSPAEDGSGAAKQWNLRWKKAAYNRHRWITSTHTEPVRITMTCLRHAIKQHLAMRQKMWLINSTKSMIGHLPGAAGGVEFRYLCKIYPGWIYPSDSWN